MLSLSTISVNAMPLSTPANISDSTIMPRGIYSEYQTFGCQNGAAAKVQILKNDTGNRIRIMGLNIVGKGGDLGVPADSIYMTYNIHDNGAYAVLTLHYTYYGTPKSRTYTVYAY